MLSPRLTNCVECTTIPVLINEIDCKIAQLAGNLYNNIVFMLNQPVEANVMIDLLNYRRILTFKYCNPDYAGCFTIPMITSKVKRLTINNKPIPRPSCGTTTTTSSSSSTTTTTTTTLPPTTSTTTSTTTTTTTTIAPTTTTTSTTIAPTTTTSTTTIAPPSLLDREGGYYYNGYIINDSNEVAPEGWHVPSTPEFIELLKYVSSTTIPLTCSSTTSNYAGAYLKSTSTGQTFSFQSPNAGASDSVGFNVVATGAFSPNESNNVGERSAFWTSEYSSPSDSAGNSIQFNYYDTVAFVTYFTGIAPCIYKETKTNAFQLRVVKDDLTGYPTNGSTGTVTDIDGNSYLTKRIGNQVWTLQNLVTSKFKDGTPISEITAVSQLTTAYATKTPVFGRYENLYNS